MPRRRRAWTDALPEWATLNPVDGYVEVDPDVVYPMWLEELEKLDPMLMAQNLWREVTQSGLEAARLIFTRYLKRIMYANGGTFLKLRILEKDGAWALSNFPVGEPVSIGHVKRQLGLDAVLGRPKTQ